MAFDLAAAVAEAVDPELTDFEFTMGAAEPFVIPSPVDLLAMDLLGKGDWVGALERLVGADEFGRLLEAFNDEGQRFTLPAARQLMNAYMDHNRTTVGESEASA